MASLPSRPGGSSDSTEVAESPHQPRSSLFQKEALGYSVQELSS